MIILIIKLLWNKIIQLSFTNVRIYLLFSKLNICCEGQQIPVPCVGLDIKTEMCL